MCYRSALPIVAQENDLIQPHACYDERSVTIESFARAAFQITCLDDSLKEQLDTLFAIRIQVMLPTAPSLGQLIRRQDPTTLTGVGSPQSCAAKGGVTK